MVSVCKGSGVSKAIEDYRTLPPMRDKRFSLRRIEFRRFWSAAVFRRFGLGPATDALLRLDN
jgi:hypothetical protein